MNSQDIKSWLHVGLVALLLGGGMAHASVAVTPSLVDAGTTVSTGVPMNYTVSFKNDGDVTIAPSDGYTFQVEIPADMTLVLPVTCSVATSTRCASVNISGSTVSMNLSASLAPGQTAGFGVKLLPSSTLANGTSLSTVASVLAPDSSVMGSVTDINTVIRQTVSYGITKNSMGSTTAARYAPGQTVSYTVQVNLASVGGNVPTDVALARITDTVPAQLSNVQWSCNYPFTPGTTVTGCFPQSGTGNAIAFDVGGGGSTSNYVQVTVTGTLDAAATVGQVISNTAQANAISPSPVTYSDSGTKSGTASFTVANANVTRYTFGKSSLGTYNATLGAYQIAQDDDTKSYQLNFTNYGPATYVGQLNDVVQSDFQLTRVTCSPASDVDCGAGLGVYVNNTSPTQSVSQSIVVPPGRTIYVYLYGKAVGPVGTVIDNTATLEIGPGLTPDAGSVTSVKPAYKTTITGQITINSKVTVPPSTATSLTTAIGTQPTYAVTFSNDGAVDATNVRLSVPGGSTAWGLTTSWTCTATGAAVCPAASGTGTATSWLSSASALRAQIPAGDQLVFTIVPSIPIPSTVVPAAAAQGSFYVYGSTSNQDASVTLVGATNPLFYTYVVTYNASVTKSSGVSSVVAGAPLSYTMNVRNTNNLAQPNLRIVDPLAGRMTNVSWSCAACVPSSGTGDIDTLATIPANGSISITLSGNASPTLPPGSTLSNTVSLLSSEGAAFASATDTINVSAIADIGVVKTANLSTYSVGVNTPVIYTVAVTNHALSTAVGTPITDTAPAGVTFNSWTCDICATTSGSGNINTTANLAQNQTATITINATVGSGATGTLTNTATSANPPGYTQDSANNHPKTASASLTPLVPELTLSKQATPASFIVGAPASYTLTVTNSGVGPTTAAATVTDAIPAGLTLGTLPAGCTAAGQTVTCTIASGLAAGTSQSFTLPVTATIAATGSVTNSASVSGGGDATCPAAAHCNASISSNVNAPQLKLEKTAGSNTLVVGVANSYTLKVTNQGTAATTATATVTDTVPTALTLGTLPAGCTAAGQSVTCTVGAGLSAGGYVSFILPVTPNAIGDITNSASVIGGGDTGCPTAARCNSEVSSNISQPQLQLSKTTQPATLVLGQAAFYELKVSNIGAAATTAETQVVDSIATSVTLGTLPNGCSAAGQVVTCTVPAGLAAGSYVEFLLPITPTVSGVPLSNTASAIGGGDPNCVAPGDCSSTITANVSAPQLELTKTASSAAFIVGQPASYTLSVLNQGDAATTAAATVTDLVPAQLTIDIAGLPVACSAVGQQVSCTIASGLAANGTQSFVIGVTPNAEQTGIVNTATVQGGGDPGCPANTARCSSSITTDFNVPALSMRKSASSPYFTVGDSASYTLSVVNNGSSATPVAATIIDTVPAVLTLGTLPAGCVIVTGQTISCTVPAGLGVGEAAALNFVIPVTPNVASDVSIANSAVVSGGGDPGCPTEPRCTSTPVESFVLTADLRINKVASSTHFTLGVPASYTLTVTNVGTTASTTVGTLTDVVPSGLTLGTLPAGCTAAGQTVTCTIAAGLATNAVQTFEIPVTPTVAATGLSNTAQLVGGDPSCTVVDPCTSPTVTLDVQSAQLSVQKAASSSSMAVGAAAFYTLNVTNTGEASTTAAVTVSDTLDNLFTIDTSTLPAACTASGQTVTCTIAAGLAAGQNVGFTINVTPTAQATAVDNTVSVTGGGDPNCTPVTPCTASVSVNIVNGAQLSVQKTVDQPQLRIGVPANYNISVSNIGTGPTDAELTVTDVVPTGLTVDAVSSGCSVTGQTVTCAIAAGLAVNAAQTFSVTATPTAALTPGSVINTATVTGVGSVVCSGSCSASANAALVIAPPAAARAIPTLSSVMLAVLAGLILLMAGAASTGMLRQRRD